jgi:hypothetical protein
VVLDTTTPGVFVTQQNTAYPGFAPLGRQINRVPFELRTLPGFDCGRKVELLLTLTLDTGAVFSIPLSLPSGEPVLRLGSTMGRTWPWSIWG